MARTASPTKGLIFQILEDSNGEATFSKVKDKLPGVKEGTFNVYKSAWKKGLNGGATAAPRKVRTGLTQDHLTAFTYVQKHGVDKVKANVEKLTANIVKAKEDLKNAERTLQLFEQFTKVVTAKAS